MPETGTKTKQKTISYYKSQYWNRTEHFGALEVQILSVSPISCLWGKGFIQSPWPSLSTKGQFQTVAYQGRLGMQKQRRSSQETIVQGPPQGIYITIYLWVILQELRSPPRWRMITSGWAQESWNNIVPGNRTGTQQSCYLTTNQLEENLHTVEENEDSDSLPKWLIVIDLLFLPLKTFIAKQNLQRWFLDMSLPSPQVAGLLNKASFSFQPTLVSQVLAFEWWATKTWVQ